MARRKGKYPLTKEMIEKRRNFMLERFTAGEASVKEMFLSGYFSPEELKVFMYEQRIMEKESPITLARLNPVDKNLIMRIAERLGKNKSK